MQVPVPKTVQLSMRHRHLPIYSRSTGRYIGYESGAEHQCALTATKAAANSEVGAASICGGQFQMPRRNDTVNYAPRKVTSVMGEMPVSTLSWGCFLPLKYLLPLLIWTLDNDNILA